MVRKKTQQNDVNLEGETKGTLEKTQFYNNGDLYRTLIELQMIPKDALDEVFEKSEEEDLSFGDLLLDKNLISAENLGRIVADLTSSQYINLSSIPIDEDILKTIPEIVAKKHNIIAFKKDKQGLHMAMSNPSDTRIIEFVSKKIGVPVVVYYATPVDIDEALRHYAKEVGRAFEDIIQKNIDEAKGAKKPEPSIVKIVDTIIDYAFQNKSSDIHIEPYEDRTLVRFRIDGILHDVVNFPPELHDQIVTRVKVMSKLRTDEHQAAQDGKISAKIQDEKIDIRVSVVPITEGEKIVMRLLSEQSRGFSLTDLGLANEDLKQVEDAYSKPHGMILSTGPTGSGKTTTLYAVLKLLNMRNVNIMTIEDPVEYDIEGVNQIQVNQKTNLTFAEGLRSIVRQDPDIILVGEIRDKETAGISINASMTGHLVLSTLHTNDAATTIPRLIDLGVEPFLVASTINVIIGQRLVRKICMNCRYSKEIKLQDNHDDGGGVGKDSQNQNVDEVILKYFGEGAHRIYMGKGCDVCHGTGYLGRIGIFEVLIVDSEIRDAIESRMDANKIKHIAVKNGMRTILEDGIDKVKRGVTTIEEILRVTKE